MSKEKLEDMNVIINRNYHSVFSGNEGLFVLQHLMKTCNQIHSSFNPEFPHVTSYNEGRRSVILQILAILQYNEVNLKEILDAKVYENAFQSSSDGKEVKQNFEDIASAFSHGLHR